MHFSWSCLAVNTISTVPLPSVKPHCASGTMMGQMFLMSLSSSILANTFPADSTSVIPR